MESNKSINYLRKYLYYFTLALSVLYMLSPYSLLGFYDYKIVQLFLRWLPLVQSFFLLFLSFQMYKGRDAILLLLSMIFIIFVGFNSEQLYFFWQSFILVVCAKGIEFDKIVKVHLLVSILFCGLNVIGYELGMTGQANNYSDGIREGLIGDWVERKDFGYGWSTDFANHVLFILLDLWIVLKGNLRWWVSIIYIAISVFIIVECDSRLAAGSIIMIVLLSIYLQLKKTKPIGTFIKWGAVFSIPIFAIMSIWATYAYEPSDPIWFIINFLVSNRLNHGADALYEFGITWFGQPVEMYGAIDAGGLAEYNYVDSSYVQYFICYGVLFTIIIVYLFFIMTKRAAQRGDNTLLFAFFVAGVSGIIAQFLFEYRYCVLILALMASHVPLKLRAS